MEVVKITVFGINLGYTLDLVFKLSVKNLPYCSILVKKFVSSTEFKRAKVNLDSFVAPYLISHGIMRTLQSEFIDPDPNRKIFFSE